jgi:hypothetical protein
MVLKKSASDLLREEKGDLLERKRSHGGQSHTLAACLRIEDLSGNNPSCALLAWLVHCTARTGERDLQSEPMLEKQKLNNQVMMINPQWAPVLFSDAGNSAMRTVLTMYVKAMRRLPTMMIVRRPTLSTRNIIRTSLIRPITELIAW